MTSCAPVIQEPFDQRSIFKQYIIHMTICLPIECDSWWLTLWAYTSRPWWMITTARFDATTYIFQCDEFPSINTGR